MNPLIELCTMAIGLAQAKRDATEQSYWEYGLSDMDQAIKELDDSFQADFDKILSFGNDIAHQLNHPVLPDKVFLVYADNGEDYEDYHSSVIAVFYSREEAESWLEDKGWDQGQKYFHKAEDIYGWEVVCSAWIEEIPVG